MFDIKENLKKLPDLPGVYMHKDKLGQVIYVGKAVSLRSRVRQYFGSYGKTTAKLRALVENIAEFEYITCASEMEALILENNLIKKHMPKYNVLLRDDKTYPYIELTASEKFPRLIKTRLIKKDGGRYFGPYSDAGAVNMIVDLLNKVFKLKRCSFEDFPAGFRACLHYHIDECMGMCIGKVSEAEYQKSIDEVVSFLNGKEKPLIRELERQMNEASEALKFEEAAKYRDLIAAAKELAQAQRVTMIGAKDMDVVLPVRGLDTSFIVLFPIRNGNLVGRETFDIQTGEDDSREKMTAEFIKQYYSKWANVPHEILVEKLPEDHELIEKFLSTEEHKTKIFVPQRGAKADILKLAMRDRNEMINTLSEKAEAGREKTKALADELTSVLREGGFEIWPANGEFRIEAYDISNTNGVDSVGAMVVFSGLKRIKKDYRRFRIKTVEGPDDYGSLQEMIYRRFSRATKGDPAFMTLPDFIFMDGGQGQVNAARAVLEALGYDIPVLGLAKDSSHRTRAVVFSNGNEIELKQRPLLFRYAGTIQEEVHRFAIDYHRNLHGKKAISSVLDEIPGIGVRRRNALLSKFGSVDAIKAASIEELSDTEGMNERAARSIKEFFGC